MTQPVISVIIPTYNYRQFLRECLESVFAQTFRDIEVIVIDDGSTDDTPAILDSISEHRLKHFRIPNSGIPCALNVGLRHAQGEFIAFLDADDRWRPQKLGTELNLMRAEPSVGVVFSDFVRFNEHGFLPNQFTFYPELASVPVRSSSDGHGKVILGDAFSELIRFGQFPCYWQATLFRREVLRDLEIPSSLKKSGDVYFGLRVYERCKVGFIPEVLTEVRRHGGNFSWDLFEMESWHLKALLLLERDVAPHHRQAVRARLGRKCASIGYHSFWQKQFSMAAKHYLKALKYPGRRMNALVHLAALPVLPFLPRRHTLE
jgi:glycosyltransferase involved in cell wall biosynthesis